MSFELCNTTEEQSYSITTAQTVLKMLSDMLIKNGQTGTRQSKIDKFIHAKPHPLTCAKGLAACISKTGERASEYEGQTFSSATHRSITKSASKLREDIQGRPIPSAARTPDFQQGLNALADMPAQAIKGHSNKGKPWRRHLIYALAVEMQITFEEAPATVIAEILGYVDEDTDERRVRQVLTNRKEDIRAEAAMHHRAQMPAAYQAMKAISQLSRPQKESEDNRTDTERLSAILDIARSIHDVDLRNEMIAVIQSKADDFDIY
ncbi:hypothetical protein [Chromobacterium subtsugae]|uniref:hypothetical protein n=1 Tax=Chromobacterium subtsugae TaxID=251747 RepID=UPI0012D3D754|nr:hypothetical protein [Chromobacterium subtsugae]